MSSNRIFPSAFLSASLVVLAAAPGVAFADETAVAPADAPAATAVRPLTMRDITPVTSIGVRSTATMVSSDADRNFFVGELALDAEVALGAHAKLFGNVPLAMARVIDGDNEGAPEGMGNVTLGALYTNKSGNLTGALGGAASFGGTDEGFVGLNARFDIPSYWTIGNVYQGFLSMRSDSDAGFFEGQATYIYADTSDFDEFGGGDASITFGQLQFGGGANISPTVAFIGEASLMTAFEDDADFFFSADVGLRGKLGDRGQSWMAKAGLLHVDDVTNLGVSLELRSDIL
jgi:hypothetical protein